MGQREGENRAGDFAESWGIPRLRCPVQVAGESSMCPNGVQTNSGKTWALSTSVTFCKDVLQTIGGS
jgi:hypothetical protein